MKLYLMELHQSCPTLATNATSMKIVLFCRVPKCTRRSIFREIVSSNEHFGKMVVYLSILKNFVLDNKIIIQNLGLDGYELHLKCTLFSIRIAILQPTIGHPILYIVSWEIVCIQSNIPNVCNVGFLVYSVTHNMYLKQCTLTHLSLLTCCLSQSAPLVLLNLVLMLLKCVVLKGWHGSKACI